MEHCEIGVLFIRAVSSYLATENTSKHENGSIINVGAGSGWSGDAFTNSKSVLGRLNGKRNFWTLELKVLICESDFIILYLM